MRGSVRQRGKTYQYRFKVKDPITNQTREISKGGFLKEKDAEKAMILAMAEYEKGMLEVRGRYSFDDLKELWLENKQGNVRDSTLYSYKRVLNARINPEFAKFKDISDIKPMHIHQFYQKLKNEGYTKKYISYVGTVIGSIFRFGVQMEIITKNPVENVDKPKMEKTKQKSWSPEEAKKFLSEIRFRSNYYLAYYIAFYTGMRVGEVLGLHWSDLDFEKKMIHVKHTITLAEGWYVIGPVKTESSIRSIPMSDSLIEMFLEHKRFSKNTSEKLVFVSRNGKIVSPYSLRNKMKVVCEDIKIPYIRFHDIRRTHTSILIDEGVSPKVVSQRLGHSDVSITLNIYTDVFDDKQVEASEKMDEILFGGQTVVKHEDEDL